MRIMKGRSCEINKKKYHWINEDIVIDFPVPKSLLPIIAALEELDEKEDYCYFDWSEALDCSAKEFVVRGKLTKKQWDLLCAKYDGR